MTKRTASFLITVIILLGLLPARSFAAETNATSGSEPVYLGTEAEYKTTFDTMFDENGLRKVCVAFKSADSNQLYNKYGLVDKYGNFVAQPIYDEIQIYTAYDEMFFGDGFALPKYFVNGYTQVVRDGKMGLMNTKGEEVIPCKYDFVGLPSEGMCRVLNKEWDTYWYLGYWNLEKNKEVVAPGKYVTFSQNKMIGTYGTYKKKPEGDFYAVNDFIEGYALVFTKLLGEENYNYSKFEATIIDKNGKNILGKTYTLFTTLQSYFTASSFDSYPQKGPYLCFQEPITVKNRKYKKSSSSALNTDTFEGYASGLAGPKGVLIKPSYTKGIAIWSYSYNDKYVVEPAEFQIITKQKKIITQKEIKTNVLGGTGHGVIDFSGKTFIPFESEELVYNEKENVFSGYNRIYTAAGKKVVFNTTVHKFTNGYMKAYKEGAYNSKKGYYPITDYFVKPDGSYLNLTQKLGWNQKDDYDYSDFSTGGYVWVQNKSRTKYGLIDFKGKTILPFEYDKVDYRSWSYKKNGYAIVEKKGKMGLVNAKGKLVIPCNYSSIERIFPYIDTDIFDMVYDQDTSIVIVGNTKGKRGIADINTGKFLLKCEYDSFGSPAIYHQKTFTYFEMGVYDVYKNGYRCFVDKNGKVVYKTKTIPIDEVTEGLYNAKNGLTDNRGRLIFPYNLEKSTIDDFGSFTIYIKNGKVYRASANYFNITFEYKSSVPVKSKELTAFKNKKANEYKSAYEKATANRTEREPISNQPFINPIYHPKKLEYYVGEAFDISGLTVYYKDIYGDQLLITDDVELKTDDNQKIYDGYKFKKEGSYRVYIYYKGELSNSLYNSFLITVKK